jgi:hypothetical protein
MMDKSDWKRYFMTYRHYAENKKVSSIEFKMSAADIQKGAIGVTDLQLQEGIQTTGSVPATRDILKSERFDIDETYNAVINPPDTYLGDQPQVYSDIKNRFFNIVNRGHAVMAIPNVYHQDYRVELKTTGLDLTIYPKDDYDFLRISTNHGALVTDQYDRTYQAIADNPLNYRYTREFCFDGGNVGDEIKISASEHYASVNGARVPLGVQSFDVGIYQDFSGAQPVYFKNRQRFMALPWGSNRVRIEFYKRVTDEAGNSYMIDSGIGYWGVAEFTQWSEGVSKF